MDNKKKFKTLNFAELHGYNKDGYLEVVSQCKIQTKRINFIDYQSLLCTKPLSEDKELEVFCRKISKLIKEHQFNFNNH